MAKPDTTPHDTFAKAAFRSPLVFRPFVLKRTSPKLLAKVNTNKIQVMPVGFPLGKPLQAADVVLRAPLLDGSGWVYWLIEHQSSHDANMPLRLLLYKVEILRYHLQSDEGRHDKRPPVILATVVYMGCQRWQPDSLDVFAPLDPPLREVARDAFAGDAEFINVKHEDLVTEPNPALQAVTLLMRRAYARDKIKVLQEAQPFLERIYAAPGGHALGDASLRYVLNESGQKAPADAKLIMKRIHESLHGLVEEKAVSIADILRRDGMQQGMQQGELNKALEIARGMLLKGMPLATIAELTSLSTQRIKQLKVKKKP